MLLNSKQAATTMGAATYHEVLVLHLLYTGCWAQAYVLLKKTDRQQGGVAAHYNMALCLMQAGRYSQALAEADSALALLAPAMVSSLPEPDEVLQHLAQSQATLPTHLHPVLAAQVSALPSHVRESLLRLQIDCLVQTQQWQEILRIASKLAGKEYQNVVEAVSRAKEHLV